MGVVMREVFAPAAAVAIGLSYPAVADDVAISAFDGVDQGAKKEKGAGSVPALPPPYGQVGRGQGPWLLFLPTPCSTP